MSDATFPESWPEDSLNHMPRRGDVVRVVGDHQDAGRIGSVIEILPANGNYERRARIRLSAGYIPTVAIRYLESAEEESS